MFFHPTIHSFLISFWGFFSSLVLDVQEISLSSDFVEKRAKAHDDYLFQTFRTLRFGGSTRCVSFSLSSRFYVKRRRIELRNEWNNEKQQNFHIRNEIMIQSEAQNREPYNNKITLCISYFSSLYPSETVAETTRQSDSPSIVLKTSFSVLLRIRLIPRIFFFFVPRLGLPYAFAPWKKTDEKALGSMSEDALGQRLVFRLQPWLDSFDLCLRTFLSQTFAQIIILCKKWITSCKFNWSVKEISLNAIV